MTAIAGVVHDGRVYLGGDRAVSFGGRSIVKRWAKVFVNGDYVLGCAGPVRAGQLMRYRFEPPAAPADADLLAHMNTTFVDALRKCFQEAGFAKKEHGVEEQDGHYMVGYRGRLFGLYTDYSVVESGFSYDAIGSGTSVVLGALFATQGMDLSPCKRLTLALRAGAEHISSVREPFDLVVTPVAPAAAVE